MGKSKNVSKAKNSPIRQVKTKKAKHKDKANMTSNEIQKTDNIQLYPGNNVVSANPSSFGLLPDWNMKLVSWNVNGLRSCIKAEGLKYILEENADIVAFQETKCSKSDLPSDVKILNDYKSFWSNSVKAGYAGSSLYTKIDPISIKYGIGSKEHDEEGRTITAEYENFYFITAYVPNSGRGLVRLDYRKNSWDPSFLNYLKELDKLKPIIVCGDLNVSHKEIDLENPKSNSKTAGFTADERKGFTNLLESVDLVDTFRHIYPLRTGAYTFWSNMRNSRIRNIGWRLDYFLISSRLLPSLCNQELRSSIMGSDHCPIVLYMKF